MREAMLWERTGDSGVRCALCNHRCTIGESQRGLCQVRENREGTLYSLVYGRAISQAVDPIEKKPLFHFHPGTGSFSVATVGCNFRCLHCQNADISQAPLDERRIIGQDISPQAMVSQAQYYNCRTIAYTYTEPTIFFEYAYDIARLAHGTGIKNVFVTNGYMTEEALQTIHPNLDAANVDLKSFSDEHYRRVCGARLEPVLDSLRTMKRLGIWVEVTTLVIPTLNDSDDELREIAQFITELGPETPWHVSRFHPTYRMRELPATPVETLTRARKIGLEAGLRYVYSGNVPGDEGENTFCYNCGKLLIRRYGFTILEYEVEDSRCPRCKAEVDGVGLGRGEALV